MLKWTFLNKICPFSVLFCRKLFTCSSSLLEPRGRFQPNLAESSLRSWLFKCVIIFNHLHYMHCLIYSSLFIARNSFSGERCGPWASWEKGFFLLLGCYPRVLNSCLLQSEISQHKSGKIHIFSTTIKSTFISLDILWPLIRLSRNTQNKLFNNCNIKTWWALTYSH